MDNGVHMTMSRGGTHGGGGGGGGGPMSIGGGGGVVSVSSQSLPPSLLSVKPAAPSSYQTGTKFHSSHTASMPGEAPYSTSHSKVHASVSTLDKANEKF